MDKLLGIFGLTGKKKALVAGGAIGSIVYIVGLVVAGTLAAPIGLGFAGLVAAVAVTQNIVQGRIDAKKADGGQATTPVE